jgi:hypothetical protein
MDHTASTNKKMLLNFAKSKLKLHSGCYALNHLTELSSILKNSYFKTLFIKIKFLKSHLMFGKIC